MLKIKDGVDLKELEKFGIKYDEWKKCYRCKSFKITTKNHHLVALNGNASKRFDKVYDLITAGLVEKVEE